MPLGQSSNMGATTAACFIHPTPTHHSMPLRPRKRRHKEAAPSVIQPAPKANPDEAIALWQASRTAASPPGTRRAFNAKNSFLAWQILHQSLSQVLPICWGDGMQDAITMSLLHVVRGLMPASRAFSQARILDEVCWHGFVFRYGADRRFQGPTVTRYAKWQLDAPRPASCNRIASCPNRARFRVPHVRIGYYTADSRINSFV